METTTSATAGELLRRFRRAARPRLKQGDLGARRNPPLSAASVARHESGEVRLSATDCAAYLAGLHLSAAEREALYDAARRELVAASGFDEAATEAMDRR